MRHISWITFLLVWTLMAPSVGLAADEKKEEQKKEQKEAAPPGGGVATGGSAGGASGGGGTETGGAAGTGTETKGGTRGKGATSGEAQNLPAIALGNPDIYEKSLKALTMLFVIAVLLESAFALLFSWRVFLTYFSLTGVKTIIMFAISLTVVWVFKVDILATLISVYRSEEVQSLVVSKVITAMILAGGSAAVNKVFVALGFRSIPLPPPEVKPPETRAWVAVLVTQKESTGIVHVETKDIGAAGPDDPAPIAGTACGRTPNLLALLLRNPNRFPPNGGREVIPGHVYEISVAGKDRDGNPKRALIGKFVFANRAIVDFDATL